MFVFKVETMIAAFKQFLPEVWEKLSGLNSEFSNISQVYPEVPSESIDYGVMEKAKNQVNIPCDIGWNDLGSWDDIANLSQKEGFKKQGDIFRENSSNCYTYSDTGKTICLSQVENLIVVDTTDALLVTQKGQSQSVKEIVKQLNSQGSSLVKDHVFEYRPWGHYRNIYEEEGFKAKVIEVDAGQQLSYQSHTKRAEIWVTVQGEGEVVLDGRIIAVSPGVVVNIPVGAKHRMRNTAKSPLKFVEVQLGEYFGEDDITRYEDDYRRT